VNPTRFRLWLAAILVIGVNSRKNLIPLRRVEPDHTSLLKLQGKLYCGLAGKEVSTLTVDAPGFYIPFYSTTFWIEYKNTPTPLYLY
jgi:hypothetical protein